MPLESDHSTFGGSSASRWGNCPGSLILSRQIVTAPSGSEWADEGTEAHAVAERILSGWSPPPHIDSEMVRHGRDYADGIAVYKELYSALYVDVERKVISSRYKDVGGTIDALLAAHRSRTIVVADYKYGAGVPVSPVNNEQLKFYAALALETMQEGLPHIWDYDVVLSIYQPRGQDPGWKDWSITGAELYDYLEYTYDRVEAVKQGDATLSAGDHCRWCEAKPVCPAYYAEYVEPFLPMTPVEKLKNSTIYDLYKKKDKLTKYLSALEDHIKAQCVAFGSFESFTVAKGKGKTKFHNPIAIQAAYPQRKYPAFYDTTLRTPKQILELYPELKLEMEGQYSQATYDKLVTNEHRDYTEYLDEE